MWYFQTRQLIKKSRNNFYRRNSKGIDDKNRTITSDRITYNKITNIVDAEGNVKIEDVINNYVIESQELKYIRSKNKI